MSIQVLNYEVQDMGLLFKQSKKKYQWTFMLQDKKHTLELEFSYLSGKRKLVLDGSLLHEGMMLTSSFQYPFTLEGYGLNVLQLGDTFELRINNKDFSHLYNQEKTKLEFKINGNNSGANSSSEPSNFNNQFSNNFNFQNNSQKINLNIQFENFKDVNPCKQKPLTTQQNKTSTGFGQPGAFEEFEQFGRVLKTENPFEESFQVSGFSSTQTFQEQKKIDLLNIDDDIPSQQQNTVEVDSQEQQINSQQTQQANLFEAFGSGWNQQQPQQYQQNLVSQTNQNSQPFDSFNLVGQIGQVGYVPIQNGFQNQQGGFQTQQRFEKGFPQAPQQQSNLNILNLYGRQNMVIGNLAYTAFPEVHNQPMYQQQPTPFDLFK